MTIEFSCQGCGKSMRAPDAAAGKKGQCPQCGTLNTIPLAGGDTPSTSSFSPPTPAPGPAPSPAAAGTLEFACGSCGRSMRSPASAAGKKGKCPTCGAVTQIPLSAPAPAAASSGGGAASGAPIVFACPSCQREVKTPAAAAGKQGKCPHCQSVIRIPLSSSGGAAAGGGLTPLPGSGLTPLGGAGLTPLPGAGLTPLPSDGGLTPLGGGLTPLPGGLTPLPQSSGLDPLGGLGGIGAGAYGANPYGGAPGWGGGAPNPYAVGPSSYGGSSGGGGSATPNDSKRAGLPWDIKQSGERFTQTARMIILSPNDAFARMKRTGDSLHCLMYATLGSIVGGAATAFYQFLFYMCIVLIAATRAEGENAGERIGFAILALFIQLGLQLVGIVIGSFLNGFVGTFIAAGIFHVLLMITGGARYGYGTTLRVVCYAVGVAGVVNLVPCLGGLLSIVVTAVSMITGMTRSHETDGWRAALAYFLPMIVCCVLVALLLIWTGAFAALRPR